MNTQQLYEQVCKYGTYYNPASKHYGTSTDVVCDRCHQNNLSVCIGYQTYDLCVACVHTLTKTQQITSPYPITQYPIAPYGYDSVGKIRKHWCTTGEHSKPPKVPGSDLDMYFRLLH